MAGSFVSNRLERQTLGTAILGSVTEKLHSHSSWLGLSCRDGSYTANLLFRIVWERPNQCMLVNPPVSKTLP